jgi:hypothetical protein
MDAMLREALQDFLGLLKQLLTNLLGPNGEEWGDEFKKFLRKEPCWVGVKANPYLKSFATGTLEATTGERTLAQADNVFTCYLDPDFENWETYVKGEPTKDTPFEVLELVKDGKFEQVFGAFAQSLDGLCWSQDQIISFVEKHADLLHPQGYPTFFLFKVGDKFFVAGVFRNDDGQLKARVDRLSRVYVCSAKDRHRFVVPQLT